MVEFRGEIEGIFVGGAAVELPDAVVAARAVAGRGLEGDRYFDGRGTFSEPAGPDRELTLIEVEAIEALTRETNVTIAPAEARRNVLTRGVPLNHLVGKEFRLGNEVVARGVRLCEPCSHLARLTKQRVVGGLVHRGGLRAQIVSGGTIRVGDSVNPIDGT